MKIATQVREDAILICCVASRNTKFHDNYREAAQLIFGCTPLNDSAEAAFQLALSAWVEVLDRKRPSYYALENGRRDADAATLLENGWSP